jgi:hypothetical protein
MSGLAEDLAANSDIQGAGKTVLQLWDAGITAICVATGLGPELGVAEQIISFLNPPAGGSSGPTLGDIQKQLTDFTNMVISKLQDMDAREAAGQVQQHANDIQKIVTDPNGPLSIIGEIPVFKNEFGLPLPVDQNPGQYQIFARAALLQLIGGGPGAEPPTANWCLPPTDLPLFKPDHPWTYGGTAHMFNQPWVEAVEDVYTVEMNAYWVPSTPPRPQFDLSALHFTNDFSPTPVTGTVSGNAFNPTWVLPQTMAAVNYYLIICGALLPNFPNDGATKIDFVGNNDPTSPANYNFLGGLSWYHDQLRSGIACIAPPFPADLLPIGPPGPTGLIPASADAGISTWSVPCGLGSTSSPLDTQPGGGVGFMYYDTAAQAKANAPASQWSRPYGALCTYTGFVAGFGGPQPSVDSYPNYVFPYQGTDVITGATPGPEDIGGDSPVAATTQWYNGFYCKYLVACLWRCKLVYNGMGLGDMWRTINRMYVMFGQQPRPGPCFGDWSLKEVFRMLGSANPETFPLPPQQYVPSAPTFQFTVRALLQFMNGAVPPPKAPLKSLRAALQA